MLIEGLFWLAIGTVLYAYFGYPLLLLIISKVRQQKLIKKDDIVPFVSIIIPAFNEESVIAEKIENTLSLEYPKQKLDIIVASDGSTDSTHDIVMLYPKNKVRLIASNK